MLHKKKKKLLFFTTLLIVVIAVLAIVGCDVTVSIAARGRLYDNVDSIPERIVGVVLGTSPYSIYNGRKNYYFDYRISSAAQLYKKGKVEYFIVSGGDYRDEPGYQGQGGYDEPKAMRDSLIKAGVDSAHIILDYDGTRTLNTIAKVRDVYELDSITLISQQYHNERALFQAKHLGVDAIGLNAPTPTRRSSLLRNRGRECIARVKLFIDILRDTEPTFKENPLNDSEKPNP